ncbi:hypothetical protein PIB30_036508 [Stylosanthes scabra]|uniref:Uncharacterized protein n=1 Tax=Stylosanthes scabra TaxID=79078 RepID=A0ABU6QDI5_9FABA|nr:hypothetical protein [Stylosanthes scabra]
MCQETLDICLDQVSHLYPSVDFSAITLKSRWDPKGRRIFVPQGSDVEEERPQAEEVKPEQGLEVATQASQPATGDVAGGSGEYPTEKFSAPGDQSGVVPWFLFRPLYRLPFGFEFKALVLAPGLFILFFETQKNA